MSLPVALACTWQPRGELPRLRRWREILLDLYRDVHIALPPDAAPSLAAAVGELPGVHALVTDDWATGRPTAIRAALATDASHVHYCDLDRALHWVETRPDELRATVTAVQRADCLILGRTDWAWATHPAAMRDTEALFNRVFSAALGIEADVGAGSRGLSRRAAEFVLAHGPATHWVDAAWPVLLHRAGYSVEALAVDGLAWETPDRDRATVADEAPRRALAAAWDADPAQWAFRVQVVAREILAAGLEAMREEIGDQGKGIGD